MTGFVACAALLSLLALGAVLAPLWRGSRTATGLMALALAGSVFALYRLVGTPAALQPQAAAEVPPRTLDEAIAQLRTALARHPEQVEGWLLLGRSLSSEQKFAEAREAFARAAALQPDAPEVLVAAAQARMLAAPDQRLDAAAVQLLERALALQPTHQRARWFLGVARRQAGQPAAAAALWQPLLDQVDARTRGGLREQIDLARRDAGLPALAAAPAGAARLTVRVRLGPALAARARSDGDTQVFVIARVPGGPPMPVAVEKHTLRELPLEVVLDEDDSPMPTQALSSLRTVEVLARLSRSGNAVPQDGDVESAPVTVTLPAVEPVELVLGR